ncbi:SLAM family member 9-like isoform X2 [Phalacrocorax aristotelis]|uniref:SLAM family member 9-like isoform X2 n=1 Tax=Phalacrocorax aristotelis TaxID=126867 RepID=UPI003F4BBA43
MEGRTPGYPGSPRGRAPWEGRASGCPARFRGRSCAGCCAAAVCSARTRPVLRCHARDGRLLHQASTWGWQVPWKTAFESAWLRVWVCFFFLLQTSKPVAGSELSARLSGSPRCREQAVPANGALELLLEKPPEGWARAEWRVTLGTGHKLRVLVAEKNKVASFPSSRFAGRAAFQQDTLSLRISPVSTADSGVYRLESENAANVFISSVCFNVSVWEPVRQPRLEARVSHQEQGWCNVSLVCTVPGAGSVSYSWFCPGEPLGALEQQPWLDVLVRGDGDPKVCNCNVSNPVSWSMASTDPVAACRRPASAVLWSYCRVKGLLCLLVLGSLVAAVAVTHVLVQQRGPPSRGAPGSSGAG